MVIDFGELVSKLALHHTIRIEESLRHAASYVAAAQIATPLHGDFMLLWYICTQPWIPLMFQLLSDTSLMLQNQLTLLAAAQTFKFVFTDC